MKEEIRMEDSVREKVEAYVRTNYKMFDKKELIIKEHDSMFTVSKHKDTSPLILSKSILD